MLQPYWAGNQVGLLEYPEKRMYTVRMNELEFDWDSKKDKSNTKKHGVSFEDAKAAFYDETAIVYHDPDNSEEEDRFILLGLSIRAGVLVVCHCLRDEEAVIRIISARQADKQEESDYWEYRK